MAEELLTSRSLPSVSQENSSSGRAFAVKDRKTESKAIEQRLAWEMVDETEWAELKLLHKKPHGHGCRNIMLPNTTNSKTTGASRLKSDRYSHRSLKTGDMKLPKQDMNRSGVLNSASPGHNPNHLSRSEPTSVARMPFLSPRSRAFTEPCLHSSLEDNSKTVHGKSFRENLSVIYRQQKEMRKLEYDNMASTQALSDAQDLIRDLKSKIEKRSKYIRDRHKKEGDLIHDLETLRKERDEKLFEYKQIMKTMNEALSLKDKSLEDTEAERTQTESAYQDHLKENTDLMRKIETREKQIKQLKEKTEKASKWKANVRQ